MVGTPVTCYQAVYLEIHPHVFAGLLSGTKLTPRINRIAVQTQLVLEDKVDVLASHSRGLLSLDPPGIVFRKGGEEKEFPLLRLSTFPFHPSPKSQIPNHAPHTLCGSIAQYETRATQQNFPNSRGAQTTPQ